MTQHTPGPWRLNTELGIKNPLYRGAVCIFGETPDGEWLSVVVSDDARAWHTSDGDQMRANAALIASAPDMLAALQLVARLAETADLPGPIFISIEERNQIRDAVTKATGGQP